MSHIKRVSVVSTGSVQIRPQHADSRGAPVAWWLLTSRTWTPPRPINVYVVEHERGLVLFDTGQDRRSVTDADYFPRGILGWLYRRLARFQIDSDETLAARLASIGYDIGDVTHVVLSHLHQDHIGGLPALIGPRILVSTTEFAQLKSSTALVNGIMANHIDLPGLNWQLVDGEHDLMGDGTLRIIPTPGHTPGSISLLVDGQGGTPLLFVGDLTYDVRLMEAARVPGVGVREVLRKSTREVRELAERYPALTVLAAHDPAAAGMLAAAVQAGAA